MTLKAVVDRDVCISCELCTQICPEVFRMEDDKAIAYVDPVPPEVEAACQEAAESCPVSCIAMES